MSRAAQKRRAREKRKAPKRTWYPGEWLTALWARQTLVERGRTIKQGWVLTSFLAALIAVKDGNRLLHLLLVGHPGQAWDGASYPSQYSRSRLGRMLGRMMARMVGLRRLEGVLAGSFFHDHFREDGYKFYVVPADQLEAVRVLFSKSAHFPHPILEVLAELETYEPEGFGIGEQARVYSILMEQWPDKDQTIRPSQSLRQRLGLYLFQPWYRVFSRIFTGASQEEHWREYQPKEDV